MQQSSPESPKIILRIFARPASGEGDPVAYSFHFTSPANARTEANSVKELLSRLIAELRGNDGSVPKPGAPAAAAPSAAVETGRPAGPRWYDDNQLRADTELQKSLLKKDHTLRETYMGALMSKPEAITDHEFVTQFFSTRTSLLRAHAMELSQQRGPYNVLSAVKPKTVDGELKISLSEEQIKMILSQHPLVARIFNENVPPLKDDEFWSRFFLSRLSKKLRGERVEDGDPSDSLFDKYDAADDRVFASRILAAQVPHTIDLGGNEENQGGFRTGNRKDAEMRPRPDLPVVKTLNSLSEKIMANVAPSDRDPTAAGPATADDEFEELALRDLRGDVEADRIVLNVKEQTRLFSTQNSAPSADVEVYARQVPGEVLRAVSRDLGGLAGDGVGGVDLHAAIGLDEESDSDDETQKPPHVGSRASRKGAQEQMLRGLRQRRAEGRGSSTSEETPMGIPADVTRKVYIANATTTEFLKQFWSAFLSGEPARAQELAYHVEALRKSMVRIDAVADEARQAREKIIAKKKDEIRAHYQRTGQKVKWRSEMVGGGRPAVMALLSPTVHALELAIGRYERACKEQGLNPSTEA